MNEQLLQEIFQLTSSRGLPNLDDLEAKVNTLPVHPDSVTTGTDKKQYTYHGGHTLLFIITMRFGNITARIMPPTRPQGLRIIETLLKKGANPNKLRDPHTGSGSYHMTSTAMYYAVYDGNKDIVELFLKYGANPDPDGTNELMFIATGYNKSNACYDMTLMLANHGANLKTARNESLLQIFENHYGKEIKSPQHYKNNQDNIQKIHALLKNGKDWANNEADRKRKEAEDAERKRQAELDRQRREAADAEKRRQAEIVRKQKEAEEAEKRRLEELVRQQAEAERQRVIWLQSEEYRKQKEAEGEKQRKEAEEAELLRKEKEVEEDKEHREEHKGEGGSYIVWALHHIEFMNKYGSQLPESKMDQLKKETKDYFMLGKNNVPVETFDEIVSGLPPEYVELLA
jgi:hypothetical protein